MTDIHANRLFRPIPITVINTSMPVSNDLKKAAQPTFYDIWMDRLDLTQKLVNNVQTHLSSEEKLIALINKFELFKKELSYFGIFFSAIQLAIVLYAILYHSAFKKEKYQANLIMKIALLTAAVPLSILGIICTFGVITSAAPIVTIISTAKGLFEKAWDLGVSIYDRFTGEGCQDEKSINHLKTELKTQISNDHKVNSAQLTDLTNCTNRQLDRHATIANSTHSLVVCAVAAVGAILLLTPAMPVGAAILAGVTVYSIMHACGYNPFKLLGQGINFLSKKIIGKPVINLEPFAHKTEQNIRAELKHEVSTYKTNVRIDAAVENNQQHIRGSSAEVKTHLNESGEFNAKNVPAANDNPIVTPQLRAIPSETVIGNLSFFQKQLQAECNTAHTAINIDQQQPLVIAAAPAA